MNLTQTVVRTAGSGALEVGFLAEGGDAIKVTIADGSSCRTDDEAVTKAKALLVQVAMFTEPGHEDRPNVEEYIDPGLSPSASKTYRLEYREGEHVRHIPEVTLPDDDAARAEVERSAIDLVSKTDVAADASGWVVRAMDEGENIVASVTYEQARRLSHGDRDGMSPGAS